MTELWFSFLWTILIALLVGMADWIINKLVYSLKFSVRVQQIFADSETSDAVKRNQTRRAIELVIGNQRDAAGWGVDLALVALSLNVACLGLSETGQITLPFFQRWNSANIDRTMHVWLIVFAFQFMTLFLTIILRHLHGASVALANNKVGSNTWLAKWNRNKYLSASSFVGLGSLFCAFVLIQNAV